MAVKSSPSERVLANLDGLLAELETIYKDIHSHPELSMQEERTASVAADHSRAVGYELTTGVGKTGVIGPTATGSDRDVVVVPRIRAICVCLECAAYDCIGGLRTGRNGFDSR